MVLKIRVIKYQYITTSNTDGEFKMHKLYTTLLILLIGTGMATAGVLGNGFTYQGELQDGSVLADGSYDLTFELFDAETNGSSVESLITVDDVVVTSGVFSVELDFGNAAFMGDQLWLEITVREGASSGAFQTLNPRQKITATPYALHAEMVALDSIGSGEIADGTITGDDIATGSVDSTDIDDGSGSNLDADLLDGLNSTHFATQMDTNNNANAISNLQSNVGNLEVESGANTANISNLQSDVSNNTSNINANDTNLQNQIDAQQVLIVALQNQASAPPKILGRSAQTSSGRFQFNNKTGVQAANAMCTATYGGIAPTAHLCDISEVNRAVSLGNYGTGTIDNVETWTVAHNFEHNANVSLFNNCQSLMDNSGEVSRGITLTVDINYQSSGLGGGIVGDVLNLLSNKSCGNTYPVMCCE